MNKYIDLHTHTTSSDGSLHPKELVKLAVHKNLSSIAITDHNTVTGINEAICEAHNFNIEVIPGIELSSYSDVEIHILGYYIDIDCQILNDYLNKRSLKSMQELRKIFTSLSEKGIKIQTQNIINRYSILNVKSIIHYLKDYNYANSYDEAYDLCYSTISKSNRLTQNSLRPEECIELIHSSGGIAFLAHPMLIEKSLDELENMVEFLKEKGLDGIECIHPAHTLELVNQCILWAERYDLLISGGSDYHGKQKPNINLGYIPEYGMISNKYLTYIKSYIDRSKKNNRN